MIYLLPLEPLIQTVACLAITHPTNPFALHVAGAALASFACHTSARKHSKRIFYKAWTPSPSSIKLDMLEDVLRDLEQAMRHWDEMARWLEPLRDHALRQAKAYDLSIDTLHEEHHYDLFGLQMHLEDIRAEVIAASQAHASQADTDATADAHVPGDQPAAHPGPQEQKGGAY